MSLKNISTYPKISPIKLKIASIDLINFLPFGFLVQMSHIYTIVCAEVGDPGTRLKGEYISFFGIRPALVVVWGGSCFGMVPFLNPPFSIGDPGAIRPAGFRLPCGTLSHSLQGRRP
ncbi:MAG: hypothetical protein II828_06100 [Clostridia bacterium]|nr:hypothetical protein [Clostridia bacterium]